MMKWNHEGHETHERGMGERSDAGLINPADLIHAL